MSASASIIMVMSCLLLIAGAACYILFTARKADKEKINVLATTLAARERLITVLQEADDVANKQKNKMSAGTISDRVNASMDILRDISASNTSKD